MRPSTARSAITISILFLAFRTFASDPSIGVDVSVATAQRMLAAPPLPSLDGSRLTVSPQYGIVSADVGDRIIADDGTDFSFSGLVRGNTAGLSLVLPSRGDFGYFIFAVANQVDGEVLTTQNGVESYAIKEIKSQSYAVAAGLSYRFLGDDQSRLAMGAFVGPAFVAAKSTSVFVEPSFIISPGTYRFSSSPSTLGPYFGVQSTLRLGNFRINPYVVALIETGSTCHPVHSDAPSGTGLSSEESKCFDGETGVDTNFGFAGYGLFLGYGSLRLNVYAQNAIPQPFIRLTSYSGSIGISF